MAKYVFAFRNDPNRTASSADEEAWGAWFGQIGGSIVDFGNRVGRTSVVGGGTSTDALSGYVVVNAESLEAAAEMAQGCPGLKSGGRVEVGEVVQM